MGVHGLFGERPHLGKGIASGLVAGAVATVAMDLLQKAQSKSSEAMKTVGNAVKETVQIRSGEKPAQVTAQAETVNQLKRSEEESQPATAKAARGIVYAMTWKQLSREDQSKGGSIVHYSFGTLMGGFYGIVAEYSKRVRWANGLAFGTALFFLADEVGVPAFRLSPPPTETPASMHVNAWFWHAVYGTTAETVRSAVRRLL